MKKCFSGRAGPRYPPMWTFPFRFRYKLAIRFDFEDGFRLTLFELEDDMQESTEKLPL